MKLNENLKRLIIEMKEKIEKGLFEQVEINVYLVTSAAIGNLDHVMFFLENGADLSFKNHDALATVVINDNIKIANYLLSKGDNPNLIKNKKNLIDFCMNKDNAEMAKLLIDYKFDLNKHAPYLLGEVTRYGKQKILELLLSEYTSWQDESDIMIANSIHSGYLNMTEFLLSQGARLTSKYNALVEKAVLGGEIKTLQLFWNYNMKKEEIKSHIEQHNNHELKEWLSKTLLKENLQNDLKEKEHQNKIKI